MKSFKNSGLLAAFVGGLYHQVLEKTYNGSQSLQSEHLASIIGALSFSGRTLEAEKVFQSNQKKLSAYQKGLCLFFLSIGLTRQSRYSEAQAKMKALYKLNLENSFYIHQANAFYFFFQGRLNDCLQYAEKALAASIEQQDIYARSLATDILGHTHVRTGRIQYGLGLMNEAAKLARQMKNKSVTNAIELAVIQYRVQFGLEIQEAVAILQKKMESIETEDSYTLSLLGLELARQLTLRGQYQAAEKILKKISFQILSSENLRYELLLNLRFAELSFQRGSWTECQHYLRAAQRGLQAESTPVFEVQTVGLELKFLNTLGSVHGFEAKHNKLMELSEDFPSIVNKNILSRQENQFQLQEATEDRIHQIFQLCRENSEQALETVLKLGLMSLVYDLLKFKRDENFLYWNEEKNIYLLNSKMAFSDLRQELTPSSLHLIQFMASGEKTKEQLVTAVWGFQYDSLRHDPMIYSAIRQLRKDLGDSASIVETTDEGYRLNKDLYVHRTQAGQAPARPIFQTMNRIRQDLNLRQSRALQLFDRFEALNVELYSQEMKTQRLMASRDLRVLVEKGYIKRIGKGRATQYLPSGEAL